MWNLECGKNESVYKTETDSGTSRTDVVVARVGRGLGRTEQDVGVSRCKLLYMEWINKKVLVFSTGNYIQYRGLNHHGREYLKKNVYIDV